MTTRVKGGAAAKNSASTFPTRLRARRNIAEAHVHASGAHCNAAIVDRNRFMPDKRVYSNGNVGRSAGCTFQSSLIAL